LEDKIKKYINDLKAALQLKGMNQVPILAVALQEAWRNGRCVYLCGNGGSAGNAIHLANDLIYGVGLNHGLGIRVEALSANSAVITCLGNDLGYDDIFSHQLKVKAKKDDVLIVLSGSGNSQNVVKAIEVGNEIGVKTFAILGYDGGRCKEIAQFPIHFAIDDMQISEDLQLIVGHMCMQWLCKQGNGALS
jgi:D-sedoheptulose 7-phosphate isomerase